MRESCTHPLVTFCCPLNMRPLGHKQRNIFVHGIVSGSKFCAFSYPSVAQDGEILPSGDCFWIEKSSPGSIEPPTKRKMTPGKTSTDVSDEEATTLMALGFPQTPALCPPPQPFALFCSTVKSTSVRSTPLP